MAEHILSINQVMNIHHMMIVLECIHIEIKLGDGIMVKKEIIVMNIQPLHQEDAHTKII